MNALQSVNDSIRKSIQNIDITEYHVRDCMESLKIVQEDSRKMGYKKLLSVYSRKLEQEEKSLNRLYAQKRHILTISR